MDDPDPALDLDPIPNPTPFFSDYKDAKKDYFFHIFSYNFEDWCECNYSKYYGKQKKQNKLGKGKFVRSLPVDQIFSWLISRLLNKLSAFFRNPKYDHMRRF